jgi:hypothetical protein
MDTAICFIIALYATKSKTYIEITVFTTPGGYCLSGTVYAFEGEFSDKQSAIQDILDNIEEYTGKSGKERLIEKAKQITTNLLSCTKYKWVQGDDAFELRRKLFSPKCWGV